jgi:hypothetical protein
MTDNATDLRRRLEKACLLSARLEPGKIVMETPGETLVWKGKLQGQDLYAGTFDSGGTRIADALVWTILEDGRNPGRFLSSLEEPAEFLDHGHRGFFLLRALLRYSDERGIETLCDWLVAKDGHRAAEKMGVEQFPLATRGTWLVVFVRNLASLTRSFWTASAPPGMPNSRYMGTIEALRRLLAFLRHPGVRAAALLPGRHPSCYFAAVRHLPFASGWGRTDEEWAPGSLAYGLYMSSLEILESALDKLHEDSEEAFLESPRAVVALCLDVMRELDSHAAISTYLRLDMNEIENLRECQLETILAHLGFEGLPGFRQWLARERSLRSLEIQPDAGNPGMEPVL